MPRLSAYLSIMIDLELISQIAIVVVVCNRVSDWNEVEDSWDTLERTSEGGGGGVECKKESKKALAVYLTSRAAINRAAVVWISAYFLSSFLRAMNAMTEQIRPSRMKHTRNSDTAISQGQVIYNQDICLVWDHIIQFLHPLLQSLWFSIRKSLDPTRRQLSTSTSLKEITEIGPDTVLQLIVLRTSEQINLLAIQSTNVRETAHIFPSILLMLESPIEQSHVSTVPAMLMNSSTNKAIYPAGMDGWKYSIT